MIKFIFVSIAFLFASGCTNMGLLASALEPDLNTQKFSCSSGEFTGTYTASKVIGGAIIVPKNTDTSKWTPSEIAELAEALGC